MQLLLLYAWSWLDLRVRSFRLPARLLFAFLEEAVLRFILIPHDSWFMMHFELRTSNQMLRCLRVKVPRGHREYCESRQEISRSDQWTIVNKDRVRRNEPVLQLPGGEDQTGKSYHHQNAGRVFLSISHKIYCLHASITQLVEPHL